MSRMSSPAYASIARPERRNVVLLVDSLVDPALYEKIPPGDSLHYMGDPAALDKFRHLGEGAFPWRVATEGEINWCVRMIGPVDEIIDARRVDNSVRRATLRRILFYLTPGGKYAIPAGSFRTPADRLEWTLFLIDTYRARLTSDAPTTVENAIEHAFSGIDSSSAADTIVKGGVHYAVIPESQHATRIMASRFAKSSVMDIKKSAATTFHARGETVLHNAQTISFDTSRDLEVPASRIRLYQGDIRMVERCLLTVETSILPESFRFMYAEEPPNPRLVPLGPHFATIDRDWNYTWEALEGTYYHVDSSNSGHFGHLTTEVISRLWGWDAAKELFPDLKLLFRIRHPGERPPTLELQLFEAFGIDAEDVVWAPVPVRVDAMVAASPLWHNAAPYFVNPLIKETWNRMSASLVGDLGALPERIFVSRRDASSNRRCRNIAEVEELFTSRGFSVLYPEDYPLAEQATRFAAAKVIAGFAGSALFNLMYSINAEQVIVLSHEAYTARNEHLFGAVLGCDVHYIWSPPDTPHPEGDWTEEAYYSSWACDLEATKRALNTILGSTALRRIGNWVKGGR